VSKRPGGSSLDRRCFPSPTSAQRREGFSRLDKNRLVARGGLIPARNHVHLERVELDPATDAASAVGGDEGRAGAEEGIDDGVSAVGEVEDGFR
jgi:hypothetical protein